MSVEINNKSSLFAFIRYLRKHIYELADNQNSIYTQEEKWKLSELLGAVESLAAFAEEIGDTELSDIIDDFIYAVRESLMGAPFKGKYELDATAYKLDEYEKSSAK